MTPTRQQFERLAPAATSATIDALFALNRDGQPRIDRALAEHGITEPEVVAQFLTCASLASDGFTNFDLLVPGIAPADWLAAVARQWADLRLTEDALEWDWRTVVDCAQFLTGAIEWGATFERLRAVCEALGIEDQSEEFALQDRGAIEL